MVKAFIEVVKDLWHFFCELFVDSKTVQKHQITTESEKTINKTEILPTRPLVVVNTKSGNIEGWTAFVQEDAVPIFSTSEILIDSRLGYLSYGDKVNVTGESGDFSTINIFGIKGWVKTLELTENFHQVYPNFVHTQKYDSKHEETQKLRRLIKDEVLGGQLKLPLQSSEFVLFMLKEARVVFEWPSKRPRLPGAWKALLRGVKGVTLSLEPHTGSVIEYAGDEGMSGFLGYVKVVRPDLSITVQSVGRLKDGEYLNEEFSHDEWKEWRPVFISFN